MPSHFREKLYLSSPVWLQNLFVSLIGWQEHNNRYTGVYDSLSKELLANEFKPLDQLEAIAAKRLEHILEVAVSSVPYYRELNLKEPRLDAFPILERSLVAQDSDRFLSESHDQSKLLTLYTGGSTGTPLKVYISKDIRRKTYAFWNRFYHAFGFSIGEKKASFVGRKVQDPGNNKPPFWRYNLIDHQLIFSSYHMDEQNLHLYIDKLNSFKPAIIEGYPLSVLRLAEFILNNNVKLDFVPKGVSTSSENFSPEQRKRMESAFGCKVFDQYGSAESVVFASECEHGKKHISMEYGIIEVLREDGTLAREGEGEFIVTTLLNDVMPLIRYKIGDLGKISYKKCQCGRESPVLEELYGKVGAVIVSQGRRVPTAAIAIAFEYLEHIKRAQIIQDEPEKAVVKLVKKPGFKPSEEEFMLWELRKMLGDKISIDVQYVDEIPPGKNGKYQMVVQNCFKA